jgi:hypothetical protein
MRPETRNSKRLPIGAVGCNEDIRAIALMDTLTIYRHFIFPHRLNAIEKHT